MARFHMSEEGILGDKDLMTLCAVMNLADPVATTGAACGTSAPVVVSPAPADPLTSFPVMGSDWAIMRYYSNVDETVTNATKPAGLSGTTQGTTMGPQIAVISVKKKEHSRAR